MKLDPVTKSKQQLRLSRFYIAVITVIMVIVGVFISTKLGLGTMNTLQWYSFIGFAFLSNLMFFFLIRTNINLRFSDPSLTREQIISASIWGMIPLYSIPEARPILLMFYLPAFSFGILRLSLRQYLTVVYVAISFYAILLIVEYVQERSGFNIQYEIFLFLLFGILLTWFASFGGYVSKIRRSLHRQNERVQKINRELQLEIEERKKAHQEKDELIGELQEALDEVKVLSGLIPICASCKKIRDDKGYWNQIESYISEHSEATFSHGICPDCTKALYPDYIKK